MASEGIEVFSGRHLSIEVTDNVALDWRATGRPMDDPPRSPSKPQCTISPPPGTDNKGRASPMVSLHDLLEHLEVLSVEGPRDRHFMHVTRDSRTVTTDSLFVAIPGAKVDGHDFVPRLQPAIAIVERPVSASPQTTVIRVANTKRALAIAAAVLHGFPGRALRMIGVTGTNGKTTVTTLIEEALHHEGVSVGRIGTTGNSINLVVRETAFTTPEAPELQALLAQMRDAGCTAVAMEASSIGIAQHRVSAIDFHTAVFTNLTQDHLDFHGTMEAYIQAKARLFRELLRAPGGPPRAILCRDDPLHLAMHAPPDCWTYGFSPQADLRVKEMTLGLSGTEVTLDTPDGVIQIRSPLVGRHNVLNLMAAYAVLRTMGVAPDRAALAIGAGRGAPGRLEQIADPLGRLVLVDYAHSDDALANVLPTVRELIDGSLWLIFGCGGDRDRGKRPKMGAIASQLADHVVLTTDNPRNEDPQKIVDDILMGIPSREAIHIELDREMAIRWALERAAPGDAVLIAGKGHETYQEVAGVRHAFDDREVVRRISSSQAT